jgi:hypothetical protein
MRLGPEIRKAFRRFEDRTGQKASDSDGTTESHDQPTREPEDRNDDDRRDEESDPPQRGPS